ncbi:MAG: tRNA (cytidine(34)-2'-O)-methyltransferase [Verrucomicrobiota bacterium]
MLNVVLYEPEIPPNTGTIGRLCHSADLRLHLIEPLGFSIDDRALKRAGLDYWSELEPSLWPSLESCLGDALPDASVYFLTTKTDRAYWDVEFQSNDYLVFGPETRGLPESLLKSRSNQCLTIPQERGRSLNLAVSVGIVAYEAIRQLRSGP